MSFLQIDDLDDFPQNICIECKESAIKSYTFRVLCESTNRLLQTGKVNQNFEENHKNDIFQSKNVTTIKKDYTKYDGK